MRGHKLTAVLCLFLAAAGSSLYAQGQGTLLGTVTDATGSAVAGATVTAVSQDTGVSRVAQTDAGGEYRIPFLLVGHYTIQVTHAGFQEAAQKDITLQVDENHEVDFTLALAAVHQTVEVTATPVAVETTNPTLGQVITSQEVAQLPLNGRDFVQLATLAPGTVKETNPTSFFNGGASSEVSIRGSFSLSVGGSRANSTDWLYDGVDNNELTAGGIAILPSIDAIQEFKVLTNNYSAEYGTRGGPTVLVTTKSGTNDFHGSLFEFLRNTDLDARSFFDINRAQFNENEFGGSLGGPIKKDKTFFFFDYQGRRLRQGITTVGTVPTPAMLSGDFSSDAAAGIQLYNPYGPGGSTPFSGLVFPSNVPFMCNGAGNPLPTNAQGQQAAGTPCDKIPSSLINPLSAELAALYPAPNVPGALVNNYDAAPAKRLNEGEVDLRLDHNFSSQDSIFARFSYDQATEFQPSGLPGFVAQPGGFASSQNLNDHGRNAALSETHLFSPSSINQITAGYNRIFNHILSYGNGTCESNVLGIPGANLGGTLSCGLTDVDLGTTFWALGDRGYAPFQGGTNVFFIGDSFDAIRGNHDVKFGGEVRANQLNVTAIGFQDGFWVYAPAFSACSGSGCPVSPSGVPLPTGDTVADFLLGLPVYSEHDTVFTGTPTGRRWKLYRPYVQDNWRVSPNLTVNLGLGWAFITPIKEAYNRQTNFDFTNGQFLVAGQNGVGSDVGLSLYKGNAEPRIGLAWSPHGDRKTSVRAGYAIFHDSSWNQGGQGLWQNPPFFGALVAPFGASISQAFIPELTPPTSPSQYGGAIETQNLGFRSGMVQQFNLNVERQIPGDVVLTVGYAGARSTHLLEYGQNIDLASPSACGTVPGYTFGCGITAEPWPYNPLNPSVPITDIYGNFDNGKSRYDSLQVKAETKSARHGLYALIGYTYSNNFDSGLSDGLGSNIGALYYPLPGSSQYDKGLSQINLRHNFTASVVYNLPFGKGKRFGTDWNGVENAILGNWQANVIEHITSGFPLFIVDSVNNSGVAFYNDGNSYNRPDRVCNGHLSNWTVTEFFDTSCFVQPAFGELGNDDRTPLSGPSFINTDFSAAKNFPLPFREGTTLQFRAEFFNIFNTPQFSQPFTDLGVPQSFGTISATVNNPRLIQFALKLTF
jgi:hypothetical protein